MLAGKEAGGASGDAATAQATSAAAVQASPSADAQQTPEAESPPAVGDAAGGGDSGGAAGGTAVQQEAAGQLHGSCQDLEAGCLEWAAEDGCIQNGPSFMFERCRKSCGVCDQPILNDVPENVRACFPVNEHVFCNILCQPRSCCSMSLDLSF